MCVVSGGTRASDCNFVSFFPDDTPVMFVCHFARQTTDNGSFGDSRVRRGMAQGRTEGEEGQSKKFRLTAPGGNLTFYLFWKGASGLADGGGAYRDPLSGHRRFRAGFNFHVTMVSSCPLLSLRVGFAEPAVPVARIIN